MATNSKMFVHYSGTKATFIASGYPAQYTNKIVFISGDAEGNGAAVYTHGKYYGNLEEAIAALKFFSKISAGGSTAEAGGNNGTITFTADDPATVAVKVDEKGVHFGLTDAFKTAVNATLPNRIKAIEDDYLTSADETAIKEELVGTSGDASTANTVYGAKKYAEEKAEAAQSAAEAKAQAAQDKADEVAADLGDVDGLSTTSKTAVGAINEVLAAVGTGGTAAVVAVNAKGGTDDYAQVYEITQGGVSVGTINIPKELVVESGEVVVNPSGQAAGTYIKLVLQNVAEPLYIDVAKLVDVYTAAQGAAQVQLAINGSNEISAAIVAGSIGTTELGDNAVTTAKIADANVTKEKLSAALQGSIDKADAAAPQATTYTKTEVDGLISTSEGKLADYYKKTETYSQAEVDAMWEWEEL